ncbi:hypothetical protein GcM3_c146o115 [Golovinomyces cichoracearum]|uniref:Secreted protein n=1 Tax=Golovinomyces cichoracearum TaxID=62708 RepID=A0A420J3F7_9PEZI|nr:hypothetical protein GcM3_c146o115 [Golovinomyces cichoracearum]
MASWPHGLMASWPPATGHWPLPLPVAFADAVLCMQMHQHSTALETMPRCVALTCTNCHCRTEHKSFARPDELHK